MNINIYSVAMAFLLMSSTVFSLEDDPQSNKVPCPDHTQLTFFHINGVLTKPSDLDGGVISKYGELKKEGIIFNNISPEETCVRFGYNETNGPDDFLETISQKFDQANSQYEIDLKEEDLALYIFGSNKFREKLINLLKPS